MTSKISPAIEVVCAMAEKEAIATEFGAIEPEHLLQALLRFGEIPLAEMPQGPLTNDKQRAVVQQDARDVATELKHRGIDAAAVRRELREVVGRGQAAPRGRLVHRSPATRALFDAAFREVEGKTDTMMAPVLLLRAVMEAPTPKIRQVLGSLVADSGEPRPAPGPPGTGSAETKTAPCDESAPAYRTLLAELASPSAPSVIAVGDLSAVRALMAGIAAAIARNQCPVPLRGKRMLDLSSLSLSPDALELSNAVTEATSRNVMLFLPPLPEDPQAPPGGRIVDLVKMAVEKRRIQCVWCLSDANYQWLVQKSPSWKRRCSVIFLHASIGNEIPMEL